MKNIAKITVVMTLLLSLLTLSSCSIFSLASGGNNNLDGYMTKDDANKLIEGIEENVTVNAGDNYNVTINSSDNGNLLAAAKGLLSTVSIEASFEITKVYAPSIFGPGSSEKTEKTAYGSGVIYKLDKNTGSAYIITNYHVVYWNGSDTADDVSDDIKIYLYGQEYPEYAINAEYIGGSMDYDIAVLKVTNSDTLRESKAVQAEFADSNETCILDTAIAIGNPEALGISATVGAVNVDSEYITMTRLDKSGYISIRVLRIDTAVNGGNSGGGLFNDEGKIIGIVNAKLVDSSIDNISYAIPSNVAKYVTDNIIYYDGIDSKNDAVYRALIGVNVDVKSAGVNYDTETGKILKYEEVIVSSVTAGSASDGKLMVNDVIKSVTIDGVDYEITRTFNVIDVMLTARQSSSVVFHVLRDGASLDIAIDMSRISLTQA